MAEAKDAAINFADRSKAVIDREFPLATHEERLDLIKLYFIGVADGISRMEAALRSTSARELDEALLLTQPKVGA